MTEPTDAEIESAWTEATGSSILPYPDDMLAFARAVLAKWGTPTPVTAESFTVPLYTADQPQAGAVPLTDEQAKVLLKNSDLLDMFLHIGWYSAPRKNFDAHGLTLIRAIEAAHGIKGGQHGAD